MHVFLFVLIIIGISIHRPSQYASRLYVTSSTQKCLYDSTPIFVKLNCTITRVTLVGIDFIKF